MVEIPLHDPEAFSLGPRLPQDMYKNENKGQEWVQIVSRDRQFGNGNEFVSDARSTCRFETSRLFFLYWPYSKLNHNELSAFWNMIIYLTEVPEERQKGWLFIIMWMIHRAWSRNHPKDRDSGSASGSGDSEADKHGLMVCRVESPMGALIRREEVFLFKTVWNIYKSW